METIEFAELEHELCELLKCDSETLYTTGNRVKFVCARNILALYLFKNTTLDYRAMALFFKCSFSNIYHNIHKNLVNSRNEYLYLTLFEPVLIKYKLMLYIKKPANV
jgi:hypothetical protein